MPFYQKQGEIPPKRHTQFRNSEGKLRYEELLSTRGFEGPYALLYHEHFPVEVIETRPAGFAEIEDWAFDSQQNRSMNSAVVECSGDILTSRRVLAYNEDLWVSIASPDKAMDGLFRNGLCDELMTIIVGSGTIRSPFGIIAYEEGDMIIMPRGIPYDFRAIDETRLLIMESRSPIVPPKKYLVDGGQWAEHAPFCERDFKTPILAEPILEKGEFRVTSKVGTLLTDYIVPHHPFDVVGWDGTHYPFAVNIREFEPVTRRIHTMPDEQQAFETAGAAICCFVPRLADYHPNALPSPPIHSNIDCDELLLNLSGGLLGWKGGGKGLVTLHPRGLFHAAKIYEDSVGMTEFQGTALAIDTFRPIKLTEIARQCSDPDYYKVWLRTQSNTGA